jgi:myo-inositol-1(or 4)-monophosphatase
VKPLTDLLEVASQATAVATSMMLSQSPDTLTAKGDRDYASNVDFAIEREVRSFLTEATPGVAFLGEEEAGNVDLAGEFWTLDPIDGTVNFVHTVPLCAVSLALVRDGRPVLGCITLPFLGMRYAAANGHGAFSGLRRMKVSGSTHLGDAIVSLGDYAVGEMAEQKNEVRFALSAEMGRRALRVRMFGSAAVDLAWLAEGRIGACVTLSNNPWDTAAGVIIAREAGAVVVDSAGNPHDFESTATVAAVPTLIDQILAAIRSAV